MTQTSSSPGRYMLNRDLLASIRLNFQHYIWKENLRYNLHPAVADGLGSKPLCIADVGTGTGIWMLDLHRELPDAELHGFDISQEQWPPLGFMPSNLSFRRLDILKDIPDEYVEKYDVVHARLLVHVVNQAGGDPQPILRNLVKLVKPGGWLQWEEPNDVPGDLPLIKTNPLAASEASEELARGVAALLRAGAPSTVRRWAVALADRFLELGLQHVVRDDFRTEDSWLALDQMNSLQLFQELIDRTAGEEHARLTDLLHKAVDEAREGVAWRIRRFVFIGQKL